MIEHAVDEIAIGGEAGVVDIADMIAGEGVAAAVGAFATAAGFVLAALGQKLVADMAVIGDPEADIGVGGHGRDLLR